MSMKGAILFVILAVIGVYLYSNTEYSLLPGNNRANLELKIHEFVNLERQERGLPPLTFDSRIADLARGHSQDMTRNNYFDHEDLNGNGPSWRAQQNGICVSGIGENIIQLGRVRWIFLIPLPIPIPIPIPVWYSFDGPLACRIGGVV